MHKKWSASNTKYFLQEILSVIREFLHMNFLQSFLRVRKKGCSLSGELRLSSNRSSCIDCHLNGPCRPKQSGPKSTFLLWSRCLWVVSLQMSCFFWGFSLLYRHYRYGNKEVCASYNWIYMTRRDTNILQKRSRLKVSHGKDDVLCGSLGQTPGMNLRPLQIRQIKITGQSLGQP